MFVLLTIDIGNERWTKSGFLTRLSNGGPPQVPGTHAGTRGVGEFDGVIAAVYEDETYYHRDQCDMITMILRLAAEPAWRYERGRQTTHTAGAAGRLEVRNPSHRSSLPLREGAVSSSVLQGSSVILRKHTRTRLVCPIIELTQTKKNHPCPAPIAHGKYSKLAGGKNVGIF